MSDYTNDIYNHYSHPVIAGVQKGEISLAMEIFYPNTRLALRNESSSEAAHLWSSIKHPKPYYGGTPKCCPLSIRMA